MKPIFFTSLLLLSLVLLGAGCKREEKTLFLSNENTTSSSRGTNSLAQGHLVPVGALQYEEYGSKIQDDNIDALFVHGDTLYAAGYSVYRLRGDAWEEIPPSILHRPVIHGTSKEIFTTFQNALYLGEGGNYGGIFTLHGENDWGLSLQGGGNSPLDIRGFAVNDGTLYAAMTGNTVLTHASREVLQQTVEPRYDTVIYQLQSGKWKPFLQDVIGSPVDFLSYHGTLYVGTDDSNSNRGGSENERSGVYSLQHGQWIRLKVDTGNVMHVADMAIYNDELYVNTGYEILKLQGDTFTQVVDYYTSHIGTFDKLIVFQGQLYVSTEQGLYTLTGGTFRQVVQQNDELDTTAFAVYKNELYIGTRLHGVFKYVP